MVQNEKSFFLMIENLRLVFISESAIHTYCVSKISVFGRIRVYFAFFIGRFAKISNIINTDVFKSRYIIHVTIYHTVDVEHVLKFYIEPLYSLTKSPTIQIIIQTKIINYSTHKLNTIR